MCQWMSNLDHPLPVLPRMIVFLIHVDDPFGKFHFLRVIPTPFDQRSSVMPDLHKRCSGKTMIGDDMQRIQSFLLWFEATLIRCMNVVKTEIVLQPLFLSGGRGGSSPGRSRNTYCFQRPPIVLLVPHQDGR